MTQADMRARAMEVCRALADAWQASRDDPALYKLDADTRARFTARICCLNEAATAIAALPLTDGWRGIEEAPRDGARVLLLNAGSGVYALGIFAGHDDGADWWDTGEELSSDWSHWQPLPEGPGVAGRSKGQP